MATQRNRLKAIPAPDVLDPRGAPPIKISATEAKNKLGDVLDRVLQSGMLLITKHEAPKAVLLSMKEYGALSQGNRSRLDTLTEEFDSLLLGMQTPKARAGMKAAFNASPIQLGKAATAAAARKPARS